VVLPCFLRMMGCMKVVSVRDVRMMARLFVVTAFVMVRGLPVVLCRLFVMLRCLAMVLRSFVISHFCFPSFSLIFWIQSILRPHILFGRASVPAPAWRCRSQGASA
jgi:hypothetical protein